MAKTTIWTLILSLALSSAALAATDEEKCQNKKLLALGKRDMCLQKERGKEVLGNTPNVAWCAEKFAKQIAAAERKATCRWLNNGDGTATDLNSGLQWGLYEDPDGGVFVDFLGLGDLPGAADRYEAVRDSSHFRDMKEFIEAVDALNNMAGTEGIGDGGGITDIPGFLDGSDDDQGFLGRSPGETEGFGGNGGSRSDGLPADAPPSGWGAWGGIAGKGDGTRAGKEPQEPTGKQDGNVIRVTPFIFDTESGNVTTSGTYDVSGTRWQQTHDETGHLVAAIYEHADGSSTWTMVDAHPDGSRTLTNGHRDANGELTDQSTFRIPAQDPGDEPTEQEQAMERWLWKQHKLGRHATDRGYRPGDTMDPAGPRVSDDLGSAPRLILPEEQLVGDPSLNQNQQHRGTPQPLEDRSTPNGNGPDPRGER